MCFDLGNKCLKKFMKFDVAIQFSSVMDGMRSSLSLLSIFVNLLVPASNCGQVPMGDRKNKDSGDDGYFAVTALPWMHV